MRGAVILCLLLSGAVLSHEMTPTYPKWEISGVDDVKKTTMRLWNSREEFDVYITENNIKRARYICALSKLRSSNESQTLLATRICSKFK